MRISEIKDEGIRWAAIIEKTCQSVSNSEDLQRAFVWRHTFEGY